jgi:GNAT superfamily N-acetyltransferase
MGSPTLIVGRALSAPGERDMTTQVESDTDVAADRVVMRPLTGADSAAYRRLRQHVLDVGEGKFYSSSYTVEQQLTTEEQWREWCTESSVRCTLGFFLEGEMIGIMGIAAYGDPRDRIAELSTSWLYPKYRRSGLARQGRERVREWCREHGYGYMVIDIRTDNTRMQETRQKEGAVYLYTRRNVTWADGSTADANYFMEDLASGTEKSRPVGQAVAFLEAALAFLKHEQQDA